MTAISSQAEFARALGVDRSRITRLKQDGRLVLTDAGLVDVEASRERILATTGGRDDVAARWARARAGEPHASLTAPPPAPLGGPETGDEAEAAQTTRADAMARKEHYLALQAKLDYERASGAVIPRAEVQSALDDLVAFARAGIENLPHRVAGLLVGKDYDAILATLRQEVVGLMADMHKDAGRKLAELTEGPG